MPVTDNDHTIADISNVLVSRQRGLQLGWLLGY